MKKILLSLLIGFMFINTSALTYGGCDYSTVSRMKSIVKNINLSYDYTIINNEAVFSITLNNLTEDIYFYDIAKKKNYYYSDTNNGEITLHNYTIESGSYKFYSNKSECKGITLGTKYYNLPEYNRFFGSSLCADIPNYSLCQKWVYVNYSQREFEKLVNKYKNEKNKLNEEELKVEYEKTIVDKIVELYIKYYYYFYGALIIICLGSIIIYKRKSRFKL